MKKTETIHRRRFLQNGFLGSTALAAATTLPLSLFGQTIANGPDAVRLFGAKPAAGPDAFHGLKAGIASYSLRKFTLDQAIAMTKEAGVKHICLKDVHLPLKSTREQRQEARRKIEAAGLVLMGGGVIYINNQEDEVRRIFDYARDAGMPTIVSSPDPAAMDLVEKMAKEYDLRIAIHNHGPGDKRYPSPLDVLRMVKDRDPRLGLCIDVGHTVRLGEDPVAVIQQCAARLYDFHLKDVSAPTAKGAAVVLGHGIINLPGVLKALLQVKFSGHLALEHELDADAPMPGILASFEYLRRVLATL